jgi:hypothetical protein
MWLPLLLAGATIGAILIAKKIADDSAPEAAPPGMEPPPGPPPGVINMSADLGSASAFWEAGTEPPDELVWVTAFAFEPGSIPTSTGDKVGEGSYSSMKAFKSTEEAAAYYDSLLRFFDANHSWWTCRGGVVWIHMYGFSSVYGTLMAPRTLERQAWTTCVSQVIPVSGQSPPPADALADRKPVHIVEYVVTGTYDLGDTFLFRTDAEAEVYYRLLHAFFSQPIIHQAYTTPKGTIMVAKTGTPPAATRAAIWEDGVLLPNPTGNS